MEFLRALPVLPVHDLDAEVEFYETLSFHVQHREDGFVALESGRVLFGLRRADVVVPLPGFSWQLEVDDVRAVRSVIGVRGEPQQQPSGEWTLRLVTPAGYELVVEGPAPASTGVDVRALALALPDVVELLADGRAEFRRVGGPWLARLVDGHAEVRTEGVTRVDPATCDPDHLEELLRSAWEENPPPPREVGPLRTE